MILKFIDEKQALILLKLNKVKKAPKEIFILKEENKFIIINNINNKFLINTFNTFIECTNFLFKMTT